MNEEPVFRPDLYRGTAKHYERYRLPYPSALVDDLRVRAQVDGSGRLLDLACGTGQITFLLSGDFDEIVAVDQEPESVAVGKAKAEVAGLAHITWQVGSAEEIALDGPFAMVAMGNAFQRLPRRRIAARTMSWLAPGGHVALLWGGNPFEGDRPWQHVLRRLMADWSDRTDGVRVPPGWQEAITLEPHEEVLERAGLRYEGSYDFVAPTSWTVETLTGFCYSTSFLSRHALGVLATEFEADLSERLLDCNPGGGFEQHVGFSYQLARKPARRPG